MAADEAAEAEAMAAVVTEDKRFLPDLLKQQYLKMKNFNKVLKKISSHDGMKRSFILYTLFILACLSIKITPSC